MKTTASDFKYFVERCRYYQKELGLTDYEIRYLHEECSKYAETTVHAGYRWATVVLATDWSNDGGVEKSKSELDATAFHEMLHVRMGEMSWVAQSRYTTIDEIKRVNEATVTALDNFFRGLKHGEH